MLRFRSLFTSMNFDFFNSLSIREAEDFLEQFLQTESFTVNLDYSSWKKLSEKGLSNALWEYCKDLEIEENDHTPVPDWIRASSTFQKFNFEFGDIASKKLLRASYILGEWFCRNHENLKWGIGDKETALKNMPVVKGFRQDLELAPLLVTENLAARISSSDEGKEIFEIAVQKWKLIV